MSDKKSNKSQFPAAVHLAAYIIILGGIMYASSFVASVLMALFISIVCSHPIHWLLRKKVPLIMAIIIVFGSITGIFFGFGGIITNSFSSFSENAPKYEENLSKMGNSIIAFFTDHGIDLSLDKMAQIFDPSKIMGLTTGLLGEFGDFMGNTFTIALLVLFLLLEVNDIPVKIKAIMKDRTHSLSFIQSMGDSIRNYLTIKTITSLLTGGFVWIGLLFVGVDYAIIWGLIAFLLNYIPNIGSIIAAVPAVLFSLVQLGVEGVFWTIGIFAVVNMVIGNIVEPKMMGQGLGLSTFVVFLSLLFWGLILGAVGMFLSVPLTMSIKIMLEQSPDTKGLAIVLGTKEEAQEIIDNKSVIPGDTGV